MRRVLCVMNNIALVNAIQHFLNELNSKSTDYVLSFTVKPIKKDC